MRKLALSLLIALAAGAVTAQTPPTPAGPTPTARAPLVERSDGPVTIEADDGIEWRRDEKVYIATGNAVATRGTTRVRGDRLIARYRDQAQGDRAELGTTQFGGDIYRFEALGGVVITTPSQKAVGERGIYEVDQQLMVLTGGDLRIEADADFVTARDSIEWYEDRQIAIARGDAAAVRGDRRVDADVLVAHVEEDPQRPGTQRLRRVEAFGAVRVTTPTQVARGDRGVYVTATDTATLAGAVKLTQGDNQLNGDYGEMNMTTGVGRLLPSPDGRVRVHGLIVPSQSQTPPARPR